MVFLVLKTLWYVRESDTVEGGQVALFMGPDYVVTVRQGTRFELESVRHDLEQHADVLRQGPAAVVHAVCDRVVDIYEKVVSDLETDVDEVEASVFSPERPHVSKRIYELNRELTTLRRAVNPLRNPMQQFARAEIRGVSADMAPFFRDVGDHLARISDAVDSLWATCYPAPSMRTSPGSACSRTTTCAGCPRGRRSLPSSPCWPGSTG